MSSGAASQRAALEAEGVHVTVDAMGTMSVDLARYGWFPRALAGEEWEGLGVDDEGDA
jgi:hypothetical protein